MFGKIKMVNVIKSFQIHKDEKILQYCNKVAK